MKHLSMTTGIILVRKKTILAMLIISPGFCLGSLPLAARDAPAASTTGTESSYPPTLPGGVSVVSDTSPAFLEPTASLREGVEVARTAPTVDFLYYPDSL